MADTSVSKPVFKLADPNNPTTYKLKQSPDKWSSMSVASQPPDQSNSNVVDMPLDQMPLTAAEQQLLDSMDYSGEAIRKKLAAERWKNMEDKMQKAIQLQRDQLK